MQAQPQQRSVATTGEVHIPMAEVVVVDGESTADGTTSEGGGPCLYPVGSVIRLQGLSKVSMNGRIGIIRAITPGTQKAIINIKGQSSPVVVGGRNIVEAFLPDMVVWTPGDTPQVAVVLGTNNGKVSVFLTDSGEKAEFEPEQLIILEELE